MRRCCAGIKIKAEQPGSSRPAPSPRPGPTAPSRGVTPERSPPSIPASLGLFPAHLPGLPAGRAAPSAPCSARLCWAGLRSARFKRGEGAEEPGGGPGELRHCQPGLCRPRHRHRPPPLPPEHRNFLTSPAPFPFLGSRPSCLPSKTPGDPPARRASGKEKTASFSSSEDALSS